MKKHLLLLLAASTVSFNLAFAQPVSVPHWVAGVRTLGRYVLVKVTNSLTKFDLDFPGGTPKDLVKAVEKAIGKSLNTVIPNEYADLKIPVVSVKNMTVAQLFEVLTQLPKHPNVS